MRTASTHFPAALAEHFRQRVGDVPKTRFKSVILSEAKDLGGLDRAVAHGDGSLADARSFAPSRCDSAQDDEGAE